MVRVSIVKNIVISKPQPKEEKSEEKKKAKKAKK